MISTFVFVKCSHKLRVKCRQKMALETLLNPDFDWYCSVSQLFCYALPPSQEMKGKVNTNTIAGLINEVVVAERSRKI